MSITVQSPSNIALVKYMGKKDGPGNLPENSSLSMTLNSLCTVVQLEKVSSASRLEIQFSDEAPVGDFSDLPPFFQKTFSQADRDRFLSHFNRVIERSQTIFAQCGLSDLWMPPAGVYVLRSANTFPAGSGIASSASSFSALTLAAVSLCAKDCVAFSERFSRSSQLKHALASLSREGSGSSCRSFEGPFVYWSNDETRVVQSRFETLYDYVILVSHDSKAVSSSEAHRRVKSSPLWPGRVERANRRSERLTDAIDSGDWTKACRIAAEDSYEMHSLFHTADSAFMYWMPETVRWLKILSVHNEFLVTLDAGPNLHVLVRESDRAQFERLFEQHAQGTKYLVDVQGSGARFR